eukprot:XP_022267034.1 uncharacterized protein LOC106557908 isoform X1 [Canis lupus familiaris]
MTAEGSSTSLTPGCGRFCSCESVGAGRLSTSGPQASAARAVARAERRRGRVPGGAGRGELGRAAPRPPRRFQSSHNAALASQFRYNVSQGAGEPARRGRRSRGAAAVTRAPGRGGRPRAAPLARSARGPAKGRSRPAAQPGPAPSPAPSPEAPAAGTSRPPTPPSGAAPAAPLLAEPRLTGRGGGGGGPRGRRSRCPRASTRRQPHRGRPRSPSAGREVREEGAPAAGASRQRGARGRPSAAEGGAAGTGAGRPPSLGRRRVPSAPAGRPRRAACGGGAVAKLSLQILLERFTIFGPCAPPCRQPVRGGGVRKSLQRSVSQPRNFARVHRRKLTRASSRRNVSLECGSLCGTGASKPSTWVPV